MTKSILYLVIAAMCLISCSTDDQFLKPDLGKEVPLKIESVMTAKVMTRADYKSLAEEGSEIGLLTSGLLGSVDPINNAKYVYNIGDFGSWEPASDKETIKLNDNAIEICAYYPYGLEHEYHNFNLTAQKHDPLKDLCYSTRQSFSNRNMVASFEMKHAYAKITFSITRDMTSYVEPCVIDRIFIKDKASNLIKGIYASGAIDLFLDNYSNLLAGEVAYDPEIKGIDNGKPVESSVLMIPSKKLGENTAFAFRVDGKMMEATISNTTLSELEAGHNYKISVIIKGKRENVRVVSTGTLEF